MAKPLKTLFLLEDLCFGGTQKQNLALACRLNRDLFAPAILTLTGQTDLDAVALAAEVPLHHLGADRKAPVFFFASLGLKIRELQPEILVPCTALPNIWGRLWGRFLRLPLVVGTVRGGGAPRRQHEWLLRHLADGIVCNSRELTQIMNKLGVPPRRLRYIANGVDTEHFCPHESSGQVITCVARLAPDKDHLTLIKAFARVASEFPQATLRIIGEGPEENILKTFVSQYLPPDLAGRVDFDGASSDPAAQLANADIFALASIREGQPNAVLEAMACGLPICATAVGGIPDIVTDNGLLSPASDSEALAANLRRLLEDKELCKAMGRKGRLRVEKDFSFASMVGKHQDFFLELWHKKQRQ